MPYVIDGSAMEIAEPVLTDGTTYVPLANVTQALGGYVNFDNSTKTAQVDLSGHMALIQADNAAIEVDGNSHLLQAPPFISEGSMWVPVRFFEALGCSLNASSDQIALDRP